ncbi:hypothetical protein KSZ_50170 [Dictyobacter formicarum]|uniref:Uncharacterized protein n=1 Tax=Dictyobacter formicarum TaxID=2778368 RepID=A0ABQ3VNN9_9CHLR|nr:hypothetical protein KSZ_50170 [Dictyobacter formicarum]
MMELREDASFTKLCPSIPDEKRFAQARLTSLGKYVGAGTTYGKYDILNAAPTTTPQNCQIGSRSQSF